MATIDIEPIKSALNHLHSAQLSSATEIRAMLDSAIRKHHGSTKMLANRLSKKQLAEEESAPGVSLVEPPISEQIEPTEPESPQPAVEEPEPMQTDVLNIDEPDPEPEEDIVGMNEDFNDLNCIVCDNMMYSATNRLLECIECHSLYHQMCHSPPIEDDFVQDDWICSDCKDKAKRAMTATPNISEPPIVPKSSSSSTPSSASSSPYHKTTTEIPPPTKPESTKSSSSHKEESKSSHKNSSSSKERGEKSEKSEKSSSSSGKKHKHSKSSKDHDRKSKKGK